MISLSNPLTEERLNKLQEDATELLKKFGILFLKNYGAVVVGKIADDGKEEETTLKLKYREFDDVKSNESEATSCECFVKKGDASGTFGGWKKLFVVRQDDHSIRIYSDEQASKSADKKPLYTIRPAGYKAVSKVSEHYADAMRQMAKGLGISEEEIRSATTFSQYSWALAHPQRSNYIFQLHKPSGESSCLCIRRGGTVEPDDAGFDRRDDLLNNLDWMKTCIAKYDEKFNSTTENLRLAFRKTCEQMPDKIDSLKGWTDNGTETEILIDMLIVALVPPLRDAILQELKGPTSAKVAMWSKAMEVIATTLEKLTNPAWEATMGQAKKLDEKIEKTVRPVIAKVLEIKTSVEGKIKGKVSEKFNSGLRSHVVPFIQPIIDAFERPLKTGFEIGQGVLKVKLDLKSLPSDKQQRQTYLDGIARDEDVSNKFKQAARDLVAPLETLKSSKLEIFEDVDIHELTTKSQDILLQTLDAAAYTLLLQMEDNKPATNEIIQQLLLDYDHDAKLKRCELVKEVANGILTAALKKLLSPVTKQVVDALNGEIPDNVKEFLDIENIFDKLIEKLVEEAVDKVVTAAYQ